MKLNNEGFYTSELLEVNGVRHGFGTKSFRISSLEGRAAIPNTEQIHGNRVTFLDKVERGKVYRGDGWMTDKKGIVCYVRTADCLPLLLFEPKKKIVAAVHCGWRGIASNIVVEALNLLAKMGGSRSDVVAAVGPRIRQYCYSVGSDLKEEFARKGWRTGPLHSELGGKSYFSLSKAVVFELRGSGVKDSNIEMLPLCTHCESDKFYSYRREKEGAGRQVNFIYIS